MIKSGVARIGDGEVVCTANLQEQKGSERLLLLMNIQR